MTRNENAPSRYERPRAEGKAFQRLDSTSAVPIGEYAARGIASLLARLPEDQRAELQAWAESLAVPGYGGRR